MRTFTNYQKDFATLSSNSSTTSNSTNSYDNITWGIRMINDSIRHLATVFYLNETTYVIPGGTVANQQGYTLPGDFESLLNCTVQVGGILYQPKESPSRRHFDALNVIPFYNDFPQFFYIYDNQILLYPTPASNSNVITLHHKKRITDISMADVTGSDINATLNSTTVTLGSPNFLKWMSYNGWIQFPYSSVDSSSGDNRWYKINTINSTTEALLKNPYMGTSITNANFIIGDVPILPEDYQDLPLYKALSIYYSTRVVDPVRANKFTELYDSGYTLLDNKYGSKSTTPVLTDTEAPVYNPNLFPRNLS